MITQLTGTEYDFLISDALDEMERVAVDIICVPEMIRAKRNIEDLFGPETGTFTRSTWISEIARELRIKTQRVIKERLNIKIEDADARRNVLHFLKQCGWELLRERGFNQKEMIGLALDIVLRF